MLIGRNIHCDIVLEFSNVSSRHCQLELIDDYWFVEDLDSTNGTKVNGMRCDAKWLHPGDELSIANHRYEVNYLPPDDGDSHFTW